MNESFLSKTASELEKLGGLNTAREISGQPVLWIKTFDLFKSLKNDLEQFFYRIKNIENLEVIFTGAGTSAFIGDALSPVFEKNMKITSKPIPTTDIVTHPEYYFRSETPTLLVSFARSGNSPESVKAVQLANKIINNVFHLVITCNEEGNLAKMISDSDKNFLFLLPEESNDKSLAMTGSFTSMLLTGILISHLFNKNIDLEFEVNKLYRYGNTVLNKYLTQLSNAAKVEFNRAVFLGSGPFGGAARESHLKLQELTNGKVICKYDSFMGFRHGPKAVMNDSTLILFLFSNREYSQKYEKDLANSIETGRNAALKIAVMEDDIEEIDAEIKVVLNETGRRISEEFLLPVSVLPAQIIGFFKSLKFGLQPDQPSENGMISRVVEGVNLYEYKVAE